MINLTPAQIQQPMASVTAQTIADRSGNPNNGYSGDHGDHYDCGFLTPVDGIGSMAPKRDDRTSTRTQITVQQYPSIRYHELSCTQPYDSQLVYRPCSYLTCTAKYANACNLSHALQLYAPSWWRTITVDTVLALFLLLLQSHFVRRIGCCQRGGGSSGLSDFQCCCRRSSNNEFRNGEEYTLRR